MMNAEVKTKAFQFIIHHSAFIVYHSPCVHLRLFLAQPVQLALEFGCGQAVLESLDAVDVDDGNLPAVKLYEGRVGLNIDLFERVFIATASREHLPLSLFAKVAARTGIENDVCFRRHNEKQNPESRIQEPEGKEIC
ncbi:MAG: hypothetical protein QOJ02_1091 [Acidobacteriota bacterium]|nr:hypothetical protein [Acidobacteriota bacterium]